MRSLSVPCYHGVENRTRNVSRKSSEPRAAVPPRSSCAGPCRRIFASSLASPSISHPDAIAAASSQPGSKYEKRAKRQGQASKAKLEVDAAEKRSENKENSSESDEDLGAPGEATLHNETEKRSAKVPNWQEEGRMLLTNKACTLRSRGRSPGRQGKDE